MRSPGQNGYRLPASPVMASPSPKQRESRSFSFLQYQLPDLIAQAQVLRFVRDCAQAAKGGQSTTWRASQRVWLPPVAGPWCNVIAGTGYIKSANDESLARDEGGGRNLFMEVVTYKTVQGRQLRMTSATATLSPPTMHRSRAMKVAAATSISRMRRKRPYKGVNCARRRRRQQFFSVHGGSWRGTVKLRRGARASLRHSSCHSTKDDMCVRPAARIDNYQNRRGCGTDV